MTNLTFYPSFVKLPRSLFQIAALFVVPAFSLSALGVAPPFAWVRTALPASSAPAAVQQHANGVAIDSAGNSYVAYNFFGPSLTFGTNAPSPANTLYSQGYSVGNTNDNEMAVAKFDSAGNLLWFHRGGGENNDSGSSIAVDGTGNAYVVGYFNGTNVTFDGSASVLSSQSPTPNSAFGGSGAGEDIFVAKYDTGGNLLWVRQAGGATQDRGNAVAVDSSGKVYITGRFSGTADFGTNSFTSGGGNDIFLAKYDSAGSLIWAKQAGGSSGSDSGNSITVDNAGNVYIGGTITDSGPGVDFGTNHVTTPDLSDDFVAKYDSAGNSLWVVVIPTGQPRECIVSHDAAGNVYVSGRLNGTSTVGAFTISSSGQNDAFRLKLDSAGNAVWYKGYGDAADEAPFWSTTDAAGNGYLTGYVQGTTDLFGTMTNDSTTGRDVFVMKIDKDGNLKWAKEVLGSAGDTGYSISANDNGNIAVSGYIVDNGNFDSQVAVGTATGGTAGFVAQISERPALTISRSGGNVMVSWPVAFQGWSLESTTTLSSPAWMPVSGVVNNSVTFTPSAAAGFYRLRQ